MKMTYSLLALAVSGAIHAAEKPAVSDSTLIVTARHWDEAQSSTPESISLLGPEQLAQGVVGLDGQVANSQLEHSSVQTRWAIRGATGLDTGLQDPVGYYLDGVALPMGGNQLPKFFNIEQLELVKGPQGALYGRNSEAGVVKLSSRAPDWQSSFSASVEAGASDGADDWAPRQAVSLRASDQLAETAAGSVAVWLEGDQGPNWDRLQNSNQGAESENYALSSGLDIDLAEDSSLALRSYLDKRNRDKARLRYDSGAFATERFTSGYNSSTFDNQRSGVHSITWQGQVGAGQLTSISGVSHFDRQFQADLDAASLPAPETLYDLSDRTLSQELRWQGGEPGETRWLLGGYLYRQDSDVDFRIGAPPVTRNTEIDQQGVAAFGQFSLPLDEHWELAVANRLEYVTQDGQQQLQSLFTNNSYKKTISSTQWLPSINLSYRLDKQLLYAKLAKGYLPGGFNYSSATDADSFSFDEQTSINAELGYKTQLLNDALALRAAAFYSQTRDKQIIDLLPGNAQLVSNAAKTTNYGLELGVDYQFDSAWRGYLELGLQHARADKYTVNQFVAGGLSPADLSGNQLPLASDRSYTLGVEYRPALGWYAGLSAVGRSSYYFDSANSLKQPGYTKLNGFVGYQFADMSVQLEGRNLSDRKIISRAVNTPNGRVVEDTDPRYIGLRFSADW